MLRDGASNQPIGPRVSTIVEAGTHAKRGVGKPRRRFALAPYLQVAPLALVFGVFLVVPVAVSEAPAATGAPLALHAAVDDEALLRAYLAAHPLDGVSEATVLRAGRALLRDRGEAQA